MYQISGEKLQVCMSSFLSGNWDIFSELQASFCTYLRYVATLGYSTVHVFLALEKIVVLVMSIFAEIFIRHSKLGIVCCAQCTTK